MTVHAHNRERSGAVLCAWSPHYEVGIYEPKALLPRPPPTTTSRKWGRSAPKTRDAIVCVERHVGGAERTVENVRVVVRSRDVIQGLIDGQNLGQ